MEFCKVMATSLAVLMVSGTPSHALTFVSDLDNHCIEQAYKTSTERVFLGDIPVEQHLITNNMKKADRKPRWIVIHDTANESKTATALAHINYYQTNKREASAHYTVDDTRIVQTVLDKDIAYHCGDKKNDKVNNKNSIGIEMCINEGGDFGETVESTIKLTQYLMDEYNIPKNRVIRHYDVTGKPCPRKFVKENPKGWTDFKNKLREPKQEKKENHPTRMTTSEECKLVDSGNNEIAKLGMGINLEILEYGDTWCKVKCNDDIGFVGTKYLFSDTVSQEIKIDKVVSMYSTTDIKSADVTMLSKGAKVGLLKKNDKWCKVKCGDEIGYIATERLI